MLKSRSGEATSSFTVSDGPLQLRDRWFGTRPEWTDHGGKIFCGRSTWYRVCGLGHAHDGETFLMAYIANAIQ